MVSGCGRQERGTGGQVQVGVCEREAEAAAAAGAHSSVVGLASGGDGDGDGDELVESQRSTGMEWVVLGVRQTEGGMPSGLSRSYGRKAAASAAQRGFEERAEGGRV